MVDMDIMLAKAGVIRRCLRRIREKTGMDPEQLKDPDVQDIFVLNLQRAVQASIGLAAHIVAEEGLGLPASLRENFRLLWEAKILSRDLAERMQRMVGFRNIAIHEYQRLDIEVLKKILTDHLEDLVQYMQAVLGAYPPARDENAGAPGG